MQSKKHCDIEYSDIRKARALADFVSAAVRLDNEFSNRDTLLNIDYPKSLGDFGELTQELIAWKAEVISTAKEIMLDELKRKMVFIDLVELFEVNGLMNGKKK